MIQLFKQKRYYDSCSEITLALFIKLLETNNVKLLVKPGTIFLNKKVLSKSWNAIYFEFLELIKNKEYMVRFMLLKEISKRQNKVNLLKILFKNSVVLGGRETIKILNRLGIKVEAKDRSTGRLYKLILNRIKILEAEIKANEEKLKSLSAAPVKNEAATNNNLIEQIVVLSKFQGYRLDPETIKLSEFAAILNMRDLAVSKDKGNGKNHGSNR